MDDKNQVEQLTEKLFMNICCDDVSDDVSDAVIDYIADTSLKELIQMIDGSKYDAPFVSAANISQFSQFTDIDEVIRIIMDSGYENMSFVDIGYFLNGKKLDGANRKYGENHYKLCAQLGLTREGEPHETTWLGRAYRREDDLKTKKAVSYKLALRIPIIQLIFKKAKIEAICGSDEMLKYLSDSTMRRRRSNIKKLFTQLSEYADDEIRYIFTNIRW